MTTAAPGFTLDDYAAEFAAITTRLADESADGALRAYRLWRRGDLTADRLATGLGRGLLHANATGRGFADLIACRVLRLAVGWEVHPLGVAVTIAPDPAAEHSRITTAVGTVLDDLDTDADPAMRIERLARNEPVTAMTQATVAALDGHGVRGYRRGLDDDPCELCVWLAKQHLDPAGYVYPTGKPMHQHPGCQCVPIPATD